MFLKIQYVYLNSALVRRKLDQQLDVHESQNDLDKVENIDEPVILKKEASGKDQNWNDGVDQNEKLRPPQHSEASEEVVDENCGDDGDGNNVFGSSTIVEWCRVNTGEKEQ